MFVTEPAVMPLWLDYVAEAVVVFDRRDKIQGWNRAAERLFRFSASDAIGQSLLLFMPHVEQTAFAHACEATRKQGEWFGELLTITSLGENLPVEARWSLASETEVIVAVFSDVSHSRKQEGLARQAREWARLANRAEATADTLTNCGPDHRLHALSWLW